MHYDVLFSVHMQEPKKFMIARSAMILHENQIFDVPW
jgi:hypothetical protein